MTLVAEVDENDPTKIRIDQFEWKYKELLSALPSSKFNKDSSWNFSLTWQTCLALKNTFKQNLVVGPNLKKWSQAIYNEKILPAYTLRSQITAPGYEGLYPHQKGDVAFMTTAERCILANGLGSGKTQSSFSAVKRLAELGNEVFPMLVACPNSTKYSWKKEIEKVWPGLTVHVIDGSAAQRKKALESPGHVYIINWESLRSHTKLKPFGSIALKRCPEHKGLDNKIKATACEVHPKELNMIEFKTVIGDEIHRIKDPASKVSRAFKAATGDAKYRFGLSGTPIASNPEDLFSPLNWMLPEAYPSKSKYIDRFCLTANSAWGGASIVIGLRPEMEEEFFAGVDPYLRRMPKEIILPFLPPVVYERRDVEMGAKQKKAYNQMKDQMIAEVSGGDIIYTTSPLTKLTRLLQFSSAYADVTYSDIYNPKTQEIENKAIVRLADPSCKLDAFMDDIPDFGDESVVVFAVSSQLINMLSARLDKLKIPHGLITGDQDAKEREFHMENFQAGDTKYILCTIAAGGTGITLTKGSTAVFLQRSWSMIENVQAEGRVHRIGSEQYESIRYIDYVTKDSSEEIVFTAVADKSDQLEVILRDRNLVKSFLAGNLDIKPE